MNDTTDVKGKSGPRRIYLEKARLLSEDEVSGLSEKEKTYAAQCKEKGVWLELFCPDGACITEEEKMQVPVFCENPEHDHSLFVDIFCPGGSCEATEPTDLL